MKEIDQRVRRQAIHQIGQQTRRRQTTGKKRIARNQIDLSLTIVRQNRRRERIARRRPSRTIVPRPIRHCRKMGQRRTARNQIDLSLTIVRQNRQRERIARRRPSRTIVPRPIRRRSRPNAMNLLRVRRNRQFLRHKRVLHRRSSSAR